LHQGVRLVPGDDPIPDLRSPARSVTLQELEQIMLQDVNEMHARKRPSDLNLRARSQGFTTARGMMREAPKVLDLSGRATPASSSMASAEVTTARLAGNVS
jgi:hypothetical protein